MKIKINCPVCSQRLRIPLSTSQLKITCPRCASIFFYQIKFPDIFKKLKNIFLGLFIRQERGYGHTNYGYTNIPHSKKVGRLFLIWLFLLIAILGLSILLKNYNHYNFIKRFVADAKSDNSSQSEDGKRKLDNKDNGGSDNDGYSI